MDLVLFYPEQGYETFLRADGSVVDVREEVASQVRNEEAWLQAVLMHDQEPVANRLNALFILDKVLPSSATFYATVKSLLLFALPEALAKGCREVLEDRDCQ
jgi:hypothetical protein